MISEQLNAQGVRAHMAKDYRAALKLYKASAKADPKNHEVQFNIGRLYQDVEGNTPRAIAHYRKCVELNPKFLQGWTNLGMALEFSGHRDEAIACYCESVKQCPSTAQFNNLGVIFADMGKTSDAILCFLEAIRLDPNYAEGLLNLTCELGRAGRTDEAMRCFKKAIALNPKHALGRANICFMMQHSPDVTPKQIFDEHVKWDRMHTRGIKRRKIPLRPVEGRRIRIGYVSGDFKKHVVASNFEPMVKHHDRSKFEIFLYSNLELPKYDKVTARFKTYADHWRDTITMPDDHLADQIVRDEIDILVDLSGHTANNRLLMFAQQELRHGR